MPQKYGTASTSSLTAAARVVFDLSTRKSSSGSVERNTGLTDKLNGEFKFALIFIEWYAAMILVFWCKERSVDLFQ